MKSKFIIIITTENDDEIARVRLPVIPQIGWTLFVDGKNGYPYECLVKGVHVSITELMQQDPPRQIVSYTLIVEAKRS